MSLDFVAKLPEQVPDALPVYRLTDPAGYPETARVLADLATRMGLAGKPSEGRTSEDWTGHEEGLFSLAIHSHSGGLTGRHRERYQTAATESFDVDDDRATATARRFLEQTQLVPTAEASVQGVTHLRTAGRGLTGEEGAESILDAGVVFRRTIEEVPVEGPGGFALVNINGDGDVVGFRTIWRPIAERAGDSNILGPERAYSAIEKIAGQVHGDTTVTRATFGYFELGVSDRQRYLQPAYIMVYVVRDDEVAYKSAEVVAATERTHEPFRGQKRFPAPRQPRRSEHGERPDSAG